MDDTDWNFRNYTLRLINVTTSYEFNFFAAVRKEKNMDNLVETYRLYSIRFIYETRIFG
jgi:hypothetical protein